MQNPLAPIWAALLVSLMMVLPAQLAAQEAQPHGIYVIYDSSNSMWAEMADGSRRYEAARQALTDFLTQYFGGRDIALRVYGHRHADDCSDSELLLPFGPAAGREQTIRDTVDGLRPKGRTPIDLSLRQALKDFADRTGDIVLISDGIESCDADPCALMREWRDKNIDIRVHVVGFGLDDKAKTELQCIAEAAGTDFIFAGSSADLSAGLSQIQESSAETVFRLIAKNEKGEDVVARGSLEGDTDYDVATNSRYGILLRRALIR